ncbi:MAG: potassium channel family protein [Candidatus Eremiobacteraeota bacterium]|nr:potassium channel family protein [Candidatus Eremiobacteraeota bacterium]
MHSAGNVAIFIAGIILIVTTLNDVFQSVIVPRSAGRRFRLSYLQWHYLWKLWPSLAWRLHPRDSGGREDFLATYAPLSLVLMLALWAATMVAGYGCLFWVLRGDIHPVPSSYWQAMYFAGTSFLTIGFGDFAGTSGITRFLSLAAGASGFGVVSVTTAYLFAIFGSFQSREAFVVSLGARAGAPPSGIGLLAISKQSQIESDLPSVMRDAQAWIAMLMESHLAYPTLAYFRSSHDYESWVGTLGTLLDAAILMMTAFESGIGQARITYNIGRHAASDLSRFFNISDGDGDAGITREEFGAACERLRDAGYGVRSTDAAWEEFAKLRSSYSSQLNSLARHFQTPLVQWVSDRSFIATPHLRASKR